MFKVVPEEGARMIALQTGDADMVMFPSPAQLPKFKDAKYTVHETLGVRVVFIGFNAGLAPLDDVRVRQALLLAVDRKAIIDNIIEGSGVRRSSACWRPACSASRTCSWTRTTRSTDPGQGAADPGRVDAGARRHPPEGRAAAAR